MFDIYFFGSLRVLIDAMGEVAAVQDRISGEAACLRYSARYIAEAVSHALRAHASQFSEA